MRSAWSVSLYYCAWKSAQRARLNIYAREMVHFNFYAGKIEQKHALRAHTWEGAQRQALNACTKSGMRRHVLCAWCGMRMHGSVRALVGMHGGLCSIRTSSVMHGVAHSTCASSVASGVAHSTHMSSTMGGVSLLPAQSSTAANLCARSSAAECEIDLSKHARASTHKSKRLKYAHCNVRSVCTTVAAMQFCSGASNYSFSTWTNVLFSV